MTAKKALELLNDVEFSEKYQGVQEYTEMLIVCKEALEKQIPKKVENYAIDCHGYMIYDCECPSWKTEHKEMYPFAYCPHCGQALIWGNYETPDPDDYCSYGELKEGDDK